MEECIKCNKKFRNHKLLENHNIKFPNCDITNYLCKICNYKTNYKSHFKKHLNSKIHLLNEKNISNNLTCPRCNEIFRDKYNLDRHLLRKIPCNSQIIINDCNNITNNDYETDYIYLIKERSFVLTNQNIFKIGRTTLSNLKRFNRYPKGYKIVFLISCTNSLKLENILINIFKEKYIHKTDYGREYFQGDKNKMINDIICNLNL